MFGVANDDSNHYPDYGLTRSNPGRGRVVVCSERLSQEAILERLVYEAFYSSTGVMLKNPEVSESGVSLKLKQCRDFIYLTKFTRLDLKGMHNEIGRLEHFGERVSHGGNVAGRLIVLHIGTPRRNRRQDRL